MTGEFVVYTALAYTQVGFIFAIFFLARGIQRVDSQAARAGLVFRLIVFPGVVALWPFLWKRWISSSR